MTRGTCARALATAAIVSLFSGCVTKSTCTVDADCPPGATCKHFSDVNLCFRTACKTDADCVVGSFCAPESDGSLDCHPGEGASPSSGSDTSASNGLASSNGVTSSSSTGGLSSNSTSSSGTTSGSASTGDSSSDATTNTGAGTSGSTGASGSSGSTDASGSASGSLGSTGSSGSTGTSVPVISTFAASPNPISAGNPTLLTWTVTGATQLTLDPGSILVSGSSYSVSPTVTTTYVLSATNSSGTVAANVEVTVYPFDAVSVSPAVANMNTGGARTFSASSSSGVEWSVDEGTNGGSIDSLGHYTAPLHAGTFHIRATSAVNPLASASSVANVYFPDAGSPNYGFGDEATVWFRGPDDAGFVVTSMLVDPNRLLLVVGKSPATQQGLAARFFLDGGLDSTFGAPISPGYAVLGAGTPVRPAPLGFSYAVPIQPSGGKGFTYAKVSLQGGVTIIDLSPAMPTQGVFTDSVRGNPSNTSVFISGYGSNAYVASIQLDGGLNPQFGDGGLISIHVNAATYLGLRSDWGLVAGTAFGNWFDWEISPDGATSSYSPVGVQPNASSGPLASFSRDRFVFSASQGSLGSHPSTVLGMLLPDAGLDPSFGDGGLLTRLDMPTSAPVALFADDRGEIEAAWSSSGCAVAQYVANGDADPAFGGGTLVYVTVPGPALVNCGGIVQGDSAETLGVANSTDGSAILFSIWH